MAVLVVIVSLALAGVWFGHWRSSLRPLAVYPIYGASGPLKVGQTEYFGQNALPESVFSHPRHPYHLSLEFNQVKPLVTENTARAHVSVLRCVLAYAYSNAQLIGVTDRAAVARACATLTPIMSGNLTLGEGKGDDDLVVAVTPRHAGTVKITGLVVNVAAGLRHGRQHIGAQMGTKTR